MLRPIFDHWLVLIASTSALVVAYSYHPNSRTLADLYMKAPSSSTASTPTSGTPPLGATNRTSFKPKPGQIGGFAQPRYSNRVPERTLWSYIVQIANATKAIHDAGMPVRILEASKILVTGKNRYGGSWVPRLSRVLT
jgi:PAB-dependent poly(A)-specific ribonuclease subunit 3